MILRGRRNNLRAAICACSMLASLVLSSADAFAQGKQQRVPKSFNIVPIDITRVVVQNGQLVAEGLIGTNPFTSVVNLAAEPAATPGACPILDLSLGPIDLNLLGLRVQTSPICLEVTAYDGGGLLGDLLCSVANLLNQGVPLGDILTLVEAQGNLPRLLNGLTQLLNGALDAVTANTVGNEPTGAIAASCTVLDLSLGPVQLNLLGLEVILDNCNNGPVTVTITAIPGGGLLGDLLCSIANLLNNNGAPTALQALLWQISRVLGGLLA